MMTDPSLRTLSLVLSSVCFLLAGPSFASKEAPAELLLIEILSEPENNLVHDLLLGLDENGDIVQLRRTSEESEDIFAVEELLEGEIVLARSSGRDSVLLSCSNCSPQEGGDLRLRYLKNGVFSTYQTLDMYLVTIEGQWEVYTLDNERIYNLTLKPNTFLGQLIGIKEILVNDY